MIDTYLRNPGTQKKVGIQKMKLQSSMAVLEGRALLPLLN